MNRSPCRRSILGSIAGLCSASLGGCIDAPIFERLEDANTPRTSETDQSQTTPGTIASDGTRLDDLFVENFDDAEYCLTVTVSRADQQILATECSVPARRGFVFEDVATPTNSYEVEANLQNEATETFEWIVNECPSESEDMNGAIIIRDGSLSFAKNECDGIAVGYELSYGDANQFEGCD